LTATAWAAYAPLSGLSLPVRIETGDKKNRMAFAEDLLFTHRGLSGPAVLQISSYWRDGTPIRLNLAPDTDLPAALARAKPPRASSSPTNSPPGAQPPGRHLGGARRRLATPGVRRHRQSADPLAERLARWELTPTGTEGYKKAEVTLGGVDTRDLSSQTMESKQPGLYFIGEVMDVTGWLGGYNFQWAWASAHACAMALPRAIRSAETV
jgi:predicted Rossmann fold flavoprotein